MRGLVQNPPKYACLPWPAQVTLAGDVNLVSLVQICPGPSLQLVHSIKAGKTLAVDTILWACRRLWDYTCPIKCRRACLTNLQIHMPDYSQS